MTRTARRLAGIASPAPATIDVPAPPDQDLLYTLRIELQEAASPIWRRVEVRGDLTLNRLHDVVQVTMGWTDSHLHRFYPGSAASPWAGPAFLTAYDLAEGDNELGGVPESETRLDQTVRDRGDRLGYVYDFGDGWDHTLVVESVLPALSDARAARCLAGERACPPEDVGGIDYFNEVAAALRGQPHELDDLDALLQWLPVGYDVDRFDVEATDRLLAEQEAAVADLSALETARAHLSPALLSVFDRMPPWPARDLARLVREAGVVGLAGPVSAGELVDETTARAVVRPWLLMLEVARGDGLPLTAAGYLRPAIVERLFAELGLAEEWIGKGNREDLTPPVADLRESAQRLRLLRKHKGRLLQTRRGQQLDGEPVALFAHLAESLPAGGSDAERDAGTLVLVHAAGGLPSGERTFADVAETMAMLGWRLTTGEIDTLATRRAADPTWRVLTLSRAVTDSWRQDMTISDAGRRFTRQALKRPSSGR